MVKILLDIEDHINKELKKYMVNNDITDKTKAINKILVEKLSKQ